MPLGGLLFHSCWQQELVESIWFQHISPQTCGVYIFIRSTYVCSFVLSSAHFFFHSRNSLRIFGVEAHQHCTTSGEHREAFQHKADESAWLGKITVRGEAWFCFIVWLALETISQAAVSKRKDLAPSLPLLEGLCQAAASCGGLPHQGKGVERGNYSLALREMMEECFVAVLCLGDVL